MRYENSLPTFLKLYLFKDISIWQDANTGHENLANGPPGLNKFVRRIDMITTRTQGMYQDKTPLARSLTE
jgi:hypothetical protein